MKKQPTLFALKPAELFFNKPSKRDQTAPQKIIAVFGQKKR